MGDVGHRGCRARGMYGMGDVGHGGCRTWEM